MPGSLDDFPLFPLGLVLLPGELLPLHIFEERYKTMIDVCVEQERDFGVIWLSDDGLQDIGCSARITEIIERMHDGRINILTRGEQPFRLLRRIDALAYPAGEIELVEDPEEEADGALTSATRGQYADLVERATGSRPSAGELAEMDAYAMAGTIELPREAKQRLLEQRSERKRLAAVASLFTASRERIDRAELASERAQTNGHVQT